MAGVARQRLPVVERVADGLAHRALGDYLVLLLLEPVTHGCQYWHALLLAQPQALGFEKFLIAPRLGQRRLLLGIVDTT